MTIKTFIKLQKISISDKSCSSKKPEKNYSVVFNLIIITNVFFRISELLFKDRDWSNDAKNSALK